MSIRYAFIVSIGPLVTLTELGITKNQSSEWQTIALVPLTALEE
jgi:hypothetical protein